jgi:hypothetical protein
MELKWKRVAAGRVSVLSVSEMTALALSEGVSKQLIAARVRKSGTSGYVKHGVGFASPVATYEALRGAVDNAGVDRRDNSWAVR